MEKLTKLSKLRQVKSSGICFICSLCVIRRYNLLCYGLNRGRACSLSREYSILMILKFSCVQGEVQYFIGVQLDGSEHVEPLYNCIPEATANESAKRV